jgi:hypothetical protein
MQAILTRYLCPTNTVGSRYAAYCDAGRLVLSADYSVDFAGNHLRVAKALRDLLGWQRYALQGGQFDSGEFAWCIVGIDNMIEAEGKNDCAELSEGEDGK